MFLRLGIDAYQVSSNPLIQVHTFHNLSCTHPKSVRDTPSINPPLYLTSFLLFLFRCCPTLCRLSCPAVIEPYDIQFLSSAFRRCVVSFFNPCATFYLSFPPTLASREPLYPTPLISPYIYNNFYTQSLFKSSLRRIC